MVPNKKNNHPILYSFRRCPYAIRSRMALIKSQQSCVLREVILRDKPKSMTDLSPKGTVPVLLLESGEILDESLDVMYWALKKNDPENWLRSQKAKKSEDLINKNDGDFKFHLDRYKYSSRYKAINKKKHRDECLKFIKEINDELKTKEYIHDKNVSFLDIAIMPFVRQFRIADTEWFDSQPYENVKIWLKNLIESNLFNTTMAKYPLWKEGDEIIIFP